MASITKAEIIMYDEPSSYLDVKQRLTAAHVIREQVQHDEQKNYVIVVEHDLSILDYLSDFVCCLYGEQSVYGIVTMPYSVREGINVFLAGYIPTENMRFRDYELTFKVSRFTQSKPGRVRPCRTAWVLGLLFRLSPPNSSLLSPSRNDAIVPLPRRPR